MKTPIELPVVGEEIRTFAMRVKSNEYCGGKVYCCSGFSGKRAAIYITGRIELERVGLPESIAEKLQQLQRQYSYEGAI